MGKKKKVLPYRMKSVVAISEMKTTTLYSTQDSGNRVLYRKLKNGKLEKMVRSDWVEVKVTTEILMNVKFREC